MQNSSFLPYLDTEIFLKLVEEILDIGFDALLKPEKDFDKNVIDQFSMLFEAASFELNKQEWGDTSLVTLADRHIEKILRQKLMDLFPAHGIIGEEFPAHNPDAQYQWILDPIDGTYRFAAGHPQFSTLIALTHNRKPVLGIIEMPVLDERWIGAQGWSTIHIDKNRRHEVRVHSCPTIAQATIYFGGGIFLRADPIRIREALKGKNNLMEGDSYANGLLASGLADIVIDDGAKPWDFMAAVPMITGAGGWMGNWQGKELTLDSGLDILAVSDKSLLNEIVQQLQTF